MWIDKIKIGALCLLFGLLFIVLSSLIIMSSTHLLLQDVESVVEGRGVEISHIDSKIGTFSIHSINDMFVLLISRDRPIGIVVSPVVGPILCRMLDSPAMFAELHTALAVGMNKATIRSEYTMPIGNGKITVSSSSDSNVTIILRSGRTTTSFYTTPDKLRRLSDELAGFIMQHGGGGTVRTPVS